VDRFMGSASPSQGFMRVVLSGEGAGECSRGGLPAPQSRATRQAGCAPRCGQLRLHKPLPVVFQPTHWNCCQHLAFLSHRRGEDKGEGLALDRMLARGKKPPFEVVGSLAILGGVRRVPDAPFFKQPILSMRRTGRGLPSLPPGLDLPG